MATKKKSSSKKTTKKRAPKKTAKKTAKKKPAPKKKPAKRPDRLATMKAGMDATIAGIDSFVALVRSPENQAFYRDFRQELVRQRSLVETAIAKRKR